MQIIKRTYVAYEWLGKTHVQSLRGFEESAFRHEYKELGREEFDFVYAENNDEAKQLAEADGPLYKAVNFMLSLRQGEQVRRQLEEKYPSSIIHKEG